MCSLISFPIYAETFVEPLTVEYELPGELINVNLLTEKEILYVESISAINDSAAVTGTAISKQYTYMGTFKLTSYCACAKCNYPYHGQPTAYGTDYVEGRTIAVDPKFIPLGSYVEINIPGEGWRRYRAEDSGGAIKQKRIDVFVNGHSNCNQSRYNGNCEVRLVK